MNHSKSFYLNRREWKTLKEKKPTPYNLVQLQTTSGRKIIGWFTGTTFEGYRLKDDDKIQQWREFLE